MISFAATHESESGTISDKPLDGPNVWIRGRSSRDGARFYGF